MEERLPVLIIAGSWNMAQFSPKWVKDNLFEPDVPEKINVNIKIDNYRVVSKTYQIGKTAMEISYERICFIASQNDKDELDKIIELAERIATLLPHTPIKALVINLRYQIKQETASGDEIIDSDDCTFMKYSKKYSFSCNDDDKKTINLIISGKADNEDIVYECNIRHNVSNTGELKRYLEPDIFTKSEDAAKKLIEGFGNEIS